MWRRLHLWPTVRDALAFATAPHHEAGGYSSFTPAAFTTAVHFGISLLM